MQIKMRIKMASFKMLDYQISKKILISNNAYNNTGGSINWRNISRNNVITVIRSLNKMFTSNKWTLGTCLEVPVREHNYSYIPEGRIVIISTSREVPLGLMKE